MVPDRLKPLYSRLISISYLWEIAAKLNNLKPLYPRLTPWVVESWELEIENYYAPMVIKLIEQGMGDKLMVKLKNNAEDFTLRAAMIVGGYMTKAEREVDKEAYLREFSNEFNDIIEKMQDIDEGARSVLAGSIPFKGAVKLKHPIIKTYMEIDQVKKAFNQWLDKHLKQSKVFERPDVADGLIRLFEEFLPNEKISFIEGQIITMLLPFGIEYKKRSLEARKRRDGSE